MFDVAPTELLLVAIVALLVIGPKDLPKAMRFVGHWVGKARGVARQFRSGFDSMVREAELAEMEKKWAEENARIMREHPMTPAGETIDIAQPSTAPEPQAALPAPDSDYHDPYSRDPVFDTPDAGDPPPVTTPPPAIRPAFADRTPTDGDAA